MICYVSAFLDIGRGEWSFSERSFERYLNCFIPFLKLFENKSCSHEDKHEILSVRNRFCVFIDEKHFSRLQIECKKYNTTNIILKKIDREFLYKNTIWNRIEREKEILKSKKYQELVSHKLHLPEHNNAEYTMINHLKIDFVNLCISYYGDIYDYFSWVDFGYFQLKENIPSQLPTLDTIRNFLEKSDPKTPSSIIYGLLNPLTDNDADIKYTLIHAPERVGGFFFFGEKQKLQEYQKLYHSVHSLLQTLNIVDDDQHIALRCYFANPSLFNLIRMNWHKALVLLSGEGEVL